MCRKRGNSWKRVISSGLVFDTEGIILHRDPKGAVSSSGGVLGSKLFVPTRSSFLNYFFKLKHIYIYKLRHTLL